MGDGFLNEKNGGHNGCRRSVREY